MLEIKALGHGLFETEREANFQVQIQEKYSSQPTQNF